MFEQVTYKVFPAMSSGETRRVEFKITGNPEDIVHIQPGCGCTANCRVEGNLLVADYTDQLGPQILKTDWKKAYPTNKAPFSKKITVFFKDDKNLYTHENGSKMFNKRKKHVDLTIVGEVNLYSSQ